MSCTLKSQNIPLYCPKPQRSKSQIVTESPKFLIRRLGPEQESQRPWPNMTLAPMSTWHVAGWGSHWNSMWICNLRGRCTNETWAEMDYKILHNDISQVDAAFYKGLFALVCRYLPVQSLDKWGPTCLWHARCWAHALSCILVFSDCGRVFISRSGAGSQVPM